MKGIFVVLTVAIVCSSLGEGFPEPGRTGGEVLKKAYNDFIALYPLEMIDQIAIKHYLKFGEVQKLLSFMFSKQFLAILEEFRKSPEYQAIVQYTKGEDLLLLIEQIIKPKFLSNTGKWRLLIN